MQHHRFPFFAWADIIYLWMVLCIQIWHKLSWDVSGSNQWEDLVAHRSEGPSIFLQTCLSSRPTQMKNNDNRCWRIDRRCVLNWIKAHSAFIILVWFPAWFLVTLLMRSVPLCTCQQSVHSVKISPKGGRKGPPSRFERWCETSAEVCVAVSHLLYDLLLLSPHWNKWKSFKLTLWTCQKVHLLFFCGS